MCGIFFYAGEKIKGREKKQLENRFATLKHRGPDASRVMYLRDNVMIGFHRLAIVDTSDLGMQPFVQDNFVCVCNGEIYNHKFLQEEFRLCPTSSSDCEILFLLFLKFFQEDEDTAMHKLLSKLDGEFVFIIYDINKQVVYYATDQLRTRPLFFASARNEFYFASEQKALIGLNPVPIEAGHFGKMEFLTEKFQYYNFLHLPQNYTEEEILLSLRNFLIENVRTKMIADRECGFLLSGGLDSSLVCGIAAKLSKTPIKTFTVGFDRNAADVLAAKKASQHIGSVHTTYIFSYEDGISVLRDVIGITETWDQTSVRASIPMYLLMREMKKTNPEICVVLSGEISDELLMGYMEWKLSPSLEESKAHSVKRLKDISYFDGLRADRVVSSVGCELRLPFFSKDLLNFVLSLDTKYLDPKENNGIEKYVLRKAFDSLDYIPQDILWRTKHAFSDATSLPGQKSWKECLKNYAEKEITDSRFEARNSLYSDLGFGDSVRQTYNIPQTKEDMLYREIFDEFEYNSSCIPYKWLPNWSENVTDASATVLPVFTSNF
jgi:asparagine synthase (glutamine-hydrolysing)